MPTIDQHLTADQFTGSNLPTLAEIREQRDLLPVTAPSGCDSWLARIGQAVAYAYRNRDAYGAEDRAEAEAELLADGYARLTLARESADLLPAPADLIDLAPADRVAVSQADTPRADDPQHTVTAYYGRASTLRRSLDRQRSHLADLAAVSEAELADYGEPTEADAEISGADRAEARVIAHRLSAKLRLEAPTLAYSAARSATATARLTAEQVADELQVSRATYARRVAAERARIAAECDDIDDLIRHLRHAQPIAGHLAQSPTGPVWRPAPALQWATVDASREARKGHRLKLTPASREGTANGQRPERPETATEARDVCRVTATAPATADAEAESIADGLARVGQSHRVLPALSRRR